MRLAVCNRRSPDAGRLIRIRANICNSDVFPTRNFVYICRQNCPSHLKFHADETSIAFSLAPDLHGRRRPAGDLPQPGHCGRHGRPDGHPGRQHLLCDGHLVGMGPLLPAVPLQRPGQLAADRAPVRAAARMDEILVLGPGTFPPQRQNIRLLYGTPENRRDVVYRRRHGRQTRRPLYRPRPDRRVRHRGDRRIRAGRCRRAVYLVESLQTRPKADRTPGLRGNPSRCCATTNGRAWKGSTG